MRRSTIGLAMLGLVLFCLPWIEIRCGGDTTRAVAGTMGALVGQEPERMLPGMDRTFTIVRSGLQLALNQASVYENGRPVEQQGMKTETQGIGVDLYFAVVYGTALVVGLVLIMVLPRNWPLTATGIGLAATLMLVSIELFSWSKMGGTTTQADVPNLGGVVKVSRQPAYFGSYLVAIGLSVIGGRALLQQRNGRMAPTKPESPASEL
jgi:hypothetical protein